MLHYLAENPWPVGLTLGAVALIALIALKASGRGMFLVVAVASAVLAAAVFAVEAAWVTPGERLEQVVDAIAADAFHGRIDALIDRLAPDVVLAQDGNVLAKGEVALRTIRATLESTRFDFLSVTRYEPHINPGDTTGEIDVRADGGGSAQANFQYNFLTDGRGTDWTFALREAEPGVWKVTRIEAVRLPGNASLPLVTPR